MPPLRFGVLVVPDAPFPTLAQRWRLRLAPGHPVAVQPIITLRPKHGMRMTVHAR